MIVQRRDTKRVPAARIANNDIGTVTKVVPFRFAGPGPRCMLTVKLLVTCMGLGVPFDWTVGGLITWSLWLYRSIFTEDGQRIPVQNLIGTRANPIRLDAGGGTDVNGASFDWTGGGDGIDGELTILDTVGADFPGVNPIFAFMLGRYNAVAPMCDAEWALCDAKAGASPDLSMVVIP